LPGGKGSTIRYEGMRITIIYDNRASREGLKTGWGFSALIDADNTPLLLFDTGNSGPALLYNMEKLGIDPGQIGIIVISHGHGDHTGGLANILEVNQQARIYVPVSVSGRLSGREVIRVGRPVNISDTVMSTGELKGIEQSLAVRTDKGIVVVTGCSHPGVGEILNAASHYGPIYGIIGGLHGFRDFGLLKGLSLVCPCHCTQHMEEIEAMFSQQYIACGAGLTLEI
jgi:7,8-dihydropterin-6-yl-methyl-4-(beta-D-ribofuranosyl)aminobenzene 5'-phosphate synthase